jgi:hypothetical protein
VLLIACAVGFGLKTYSVWHEGPWDLPQPIKRSAPTVKPAPPPAGPTGQRLVGTESIVSKNLFDPERGAAKSQESEAELRAVQRVRNLVLLGTAIIGNSAFAIVQEPDNNQPVPGAPNQPRGQAVRRLKLGDFVEGFSVSEIADKKVILTKGATRVEVSVDYFRKVAPVAGPVPGPGVIPQPNPNNPVAVPVQPTVPVPGAPNVIPNLPRRPRLPTPPSP